MYEPLTVLCACMDSDINLVGKWRYCWWKYSIGADTMDILLTSNSQSTLVVLTILYLTILITCLE